MGMVLLFLLGWVDPALASPSAEEFLVEQGSELPMLVPSPPAAAAARQLAVLKPQIHGAASWYGPGFFGRRTARGKPFGQGH